MEQADRDWLVTLKKAKKKLITQRAAAEELGLSIRQVKRLLYGLKKRGDKAGARTAFMQAAEADPRSEAGREAQRHLDNL